METKEPEKARSIRLVVNGKEISLNPFATHILGSTIWSMVSSLKLEEKPERMVIELSQ
jgi:hypothetical protein